jgi:ketosteroid isomerase-like protein
MQGMRFCPSSQSRSKRRFWLIYIQGQERRETIQRFSLCGRWGSHTSDTHFAKGENVNITLRLAAVVTASTAFLLSIQPYSWAQSEGNAAAEQQVRKAEEERREAILRNDIKALGLLMAPEYTAIFNLTGGRVTTKADELAMDQPGARKVESWDPTDVSIQIYGDVGLVIGLAEVTDVLKGERRHIRFRYTHVWVKRNGSWQLVHRHTTRVATIEGPEPPR